MAEHKAGEPCPGCTPELIMAKMERNPHFTFFACHDCLDHGALFHAMKNNQRDKEDATNSAGGEGLALSQEAHGQG